jgi:uncharacterized protein YdeI (YjbR/CyaY-like superfamily)
MMITKIEDFFAKGCGRCERFATADCSAHVWNAGLRALRSLCLDAGLQETVKWGHPCYVHAGRNVALIGALRGEFRLNFFQAALLKDPHGVLEKQGPNTQHADSIRFTKNAVPAATARIVTAYLREAMGYAEAGTKAAKTTAPLELPVELTAALAADLELAQAWDALTPGRQRGYVINLNGAKQAATRTMRIAKFRANILAGKGENGR